MPLQNNFACKDWPIMRPLDGGIMYCMAWLTTYADM